MYMEPQEARSSLRVPRAGYQAASFDELPFCGISMADIRALPKVDLHRHLVGSIRPEVIVRTATRLGIDLSLGLDVDRVRSKLVLREPGEMDYRAFLGRRVWGEFKAILASERGCANALYWAVADAHADGLAYAEFRVAPYGIGPDERMPLQQFLNGLRRGLRAATRDFASMDARIILSVGRRAVEERWPRHMRGELLARTIGAARDNRDIIVGLDISGDEDKYPNRHFADFAELAKAAGVPFTIHAGETGRCESVWEAIDVLQADRIGHGIAAAGDERLMRELAERKIPVEVCVTSNYILGVVDRYAEHPFGQLHRSGVLVTVNTDDPVLFDETTLSREYYSLVQANLITPQDIPRLIMRSVDASFLADGAKDALRLRIRSAAAHLDVLDWATSEGSLV